MERGGRMSHTEGRPVNLWILLSDGKHLEDCEQSRHLTSDLGFRKIPLPVYLRKGHRGARTEARWQSKKLIQETKSKIMEAPSAGYGEEGADSGCVSKVETLGFVDWLM